MVYLIPAGSESRGHGRCACRESAKNPGKRPGTGKAFFPARRAAGRIRRGSWAFCVLLVSLCLCPERAPVAAAGAERVAVVGNLDSLVRSHAARKIEQAGIEHDFIPMEYLHLRGLDADEYGLLILFSPSRPQESILAEPESAFRIIMKYLDSGGKAIIFLPGAVRGRGESLLSELTGSGRVEVVRDNSDLLFYFTWTDAEGEKLKISNAPSATQWFTHISEPDPKKAEVSAYWHDYSGKRKSPAIIRFPSGYIANMNFLGGHRLFLAKAAVELLPGIGERVWGRLSESFEMARESTSAEKLSGQGRDKMEEARSLFRQAGERAGEGLYSDAIVLLLAAERKNLEAYAVSMPGIPGEERMVSLPGRTEFDPGILCERLAKAGFSGINFHIRPYLYPSRIHGTHREWSIETDLMRELIDAAHRHGLKAGPNISPFLIYKGSEAYDRMVEEDWRVVASADIGRERGVWEPGLRATPCRARPGAVDYGVAKAVEIAGTYPVDYIVLDYIRWDSYCYCDFCRENFQTDTGLEIEEWPLDVMARHKEAFDTWRAKPVTEVVRRISEKIAEINPDIRLGASVRPGESQNVREAQHWWEWTGYLDFISPMRYTPENEELEYTLRRFEALIPEDGRARLMPIVAAPGRSRALSYLAGLQQIDIVRDIAPAGIRYFGHPYGDCAYLGLLEMGPFKK